MNETIKKVFEIIYNNGPEKFIYELETLSHVEIKGNSLQLDFFEGMLEIPIEESFDLLDNDIEDNFSTLFILECLYRLKDLSKSGKQCIKDADYIYIVPVFSYLIIDTHVLYLGGQIIPLDSETYFASEGDLAAQWLEKIIRTCKLIQK